LIALQRHPESRRGAVQRVGAAAIRNGDRLALRYLIEGDLDAVRLPLRGERPLWQHTCCEAFVGGPGSPGYQELNFSPSGDWSAYAFARYRDGGPAEVPDPQIVVKLSKHALELSASARVPAGPLQLALTAVVEERDGTLSYWALRHAPGKPDFHHRAGFALELA
jgi:hypothetical protein